MQTDARTAKYPPVLHQVAQQNALRMLVLQLQHNTKTQLQCRPRQQFMMRTKEMDNVRMVMLQQSRNIDDDDDEPFIVSQMEIKRVR